MKVPIIVSCLISFSSARFDMGHFALCVGYSCRSVCIRFLRESEKCLARVIQGQAGFVTQTCLQSSYIAEEPSHLQSDAKRCH